MLKMEGASREILYQANFVQNFVQSFYMERWKPSEVWTFAQTAWLIMAGLLIESISSSQSNAYIYLFSCCYI